MNQEVAEHQAIGAIKYYNWHEINSLAVKAASMHAVCVGNGLEYVTPEDNEIWRCIQDSMRNIYGDKSSKFYDVMSGLVSGGMFFFVSPDEARRFYQVFELPLVDSSAVYACLYNSDGTCATENT
jgi:hypothetical protein